MAENKPVNLTFELIGDDFPHAWFFNRFRVDRLGASSIVTFALITEGGGMPDVNAIVLSDTDLQNSRDRSLEFLHKAGDVAPTSNATLGFTTPPKRVYPVNHINLARINTMCEIGFYRFSINTLVDRMREARENPLAKAGSVRCYPVVMFRCDLETQIELIKRIYAK